MSGLFDGFKRSKSHRDQTDFLKICLSKNGHKGNTLYKRYNCKTAVFPQDSLQPAHSILNMHLII